jgi:hypothetical protein
MAYRRKWLASLLDLAAGVSARTILAQNPSGLPEFSQRFQAMSLPLAAS